MVLSTGDRSAQIRTVYFEDATVEGNGESLTTTGIVRVVEVSGASAVSESQIAWGPSLIDEDLLAQLDEIRARGYQLLPGEASTAT